MASIQHLTDQDRLTVIAPHPDDESLGVGGIIWQARQKNIPVSVIFLTNGDGNRVGVAQHYHRLLPKAEQYRNYGRMRQKEAVRALGHLGVTPEFIHFLGLPDLGLTRILQPKYAQVAYRSRFTKTTTVPYSTTFAPHLAYAKIPARSTLRHLIDLTEPTIILLPLLDDTHSDHRAAARLAIEAARQGPDSPAIYAYPIHYKFFPKPAGQNSSLPLLPPTMHPRTDWENVALVPKARLAKEKAISEYQSQLQIPLLGKLMYSLVRSNELLLPLIHA